MDIRTQLNALETRIEGKRNPAESVSARIAHLERILFGQPNPGSLVDRLRKLAEVSGISLLQNAEEVGQSTSSQMPPDTVTNTVSCQTGIFHSDNLPAPVLQGQAETEVLEASTSSETIATNAAQRISDIDAIANQLFAQSLTKKKRMHPVRQKILYTAAVAGLGATSQLNAGCVGNVIFGTARRSFSCPLCHWISRF